MSKKAVDEAWDCADEWKQRCEKLEVEVKVLTCDRDVWRSRAESKMAVWRETLEKCVSSLEAHRDCPIWNFDEKDIPAVEAARELLEVTP